MMDIRNTFSTDIARGVQDKALEMGYSVVICNSDWDLRKERSHIELVRDEQMAGCIVTPADAGLTDLTLLTESGIPVVAVNNDFVGAPHDAVRLDNREAAAQATRHLLQQGFKRVACIIGPDSNLSGSERAQGYLDVIGADEAELVHEVYHEDGGYRAMQALLRRAPQPDAFLVGNNDMMLGAIRAIRDTGHAIRDFGLIGFDEIACADITDPPLSTIAQPAYEMGRTAAELLGARIQGDNSSPKTITLASTLRVRGSSLRQENSGR